MYSNIVFLGNCQADVLRLLYLIKVNRFSNAKVVHINSAAPLRAEHRHLLEAADAIVQQVFSWPQPGSLEGISTQAKVIKFPYVSAHFLWPYAGTSHPVARVGSDPNPFFGVELGDGRLVKIIKSQHDREDDLAQYIDDDLAKTCSLARLYEMHMEMQAERDRQAGGIAVTPLIEAGLKHRRLFTSPGHPTLELFLPVLDHVLEELEVPSSLRSAIQGGTLILPSSPIEVPIHPSVSQHFGLPHGGQGDVFISPLGEQIDFLTSARSYVFLDYNHALFSALQKFRNHNDFDQKQIEVAIKELQAAIIDSAGSIEAEVLLARLYFKQGDPSRALLHARKALRLQPDAASAWFNYAVAACRANDYLLAEQAFAATLERSPNAALVHSELSLVYEQRGQGAKALEAAEIALSLDSWDPVISQRSARLNARYR